MIPLDPHDLLATESASPGASVKVGKAGRARSTGDAHARRMAQRNAKTRSRILKAARGLFAEMGYEAVTLRLIAASVGCSAPALLNHFPSKNALLMAVCSEDFRTLQEALVPHIATVADPIERLALIGRGYVAFAKDHPHHYRLMFMTQLPAPEVAELAIERGNPDQDAYALLRKHVSEAIDAGRFRPELTDPDLVAQALWGSVHGVVALNETKGHDSWCPWKPLNETAELVISGLLRGMLRESQP